jgi:predicted Rossmann fold nucleotide-binding protein DprA/Smf involved in DNA uptake
MYLRSFPPALLEDVSTNKDWSFDDGSRTIVLGQYHFANLFQYHSRADSAPLLLGLRIKMAVLNVHAITVVGTRRSASVHRNARLGY